MALSVTFLAGTLGQGGAERQLFYMVKALVHAQIECRVLCFTRDEFYEREIKRLGVQVLWVGRSSNVAVRLARIISCLNSTPPSIIQSVHAYTNLYSAIAGFVCGTKSIGAIRSNGIYDFEDIKLFAYLSLRCPSALIVNSRTAIETLARSGVDANRMHLLENVVDTAIFKPIKSLDGKGGAIVALSVGSLRPVKRHDTFLRSLALARERLSDLRGRIVGDGPLKEDLERLAFELNLEGYIEFVGRRENLAPFYQDASMLVHTAAADGMSNVIMEAMSCGLPVVSTNVGAAADLVIDGKTGYLTNIGAAEHIAEHIVALAMNARQRDYMGLAGRDHIVNNYGHEELLSKMLGIYDRILK